MCAASARLAVGLSLGDVCVCVWLPLEPGPVGPAVPHQHLASLRCVCVCVCVRVRVRVCACMCESAFGRMTRRSRFPGTVPVSGGLSWLERAPEMSPFLKWNEIYFFKNLNRKKLADEYTFTYIR